MRLSLKKTKACRCILMLLFILSMQLQGLTSVALCENIGPLKKPEIEMTPDILIEDESDPSADKENSNWLKRNKWWVALGGILLGGAAVVAVTSTSDGEDGDIGNGSLKVNW